MDLHRDLPTHRQTADHRPLDAEPVQQRGGALREGGAVDMPFS
ncbi:hypothetical protein [Streptomyces sp. NPDC018833]